MPDFMSALTAQSIVCQEYTIYFDNWSRLSTKIKDGDYSKVICIVDDNTISHCLPILESRIASEVNKIIIKSGEKYKTIDTCSKIWKEMMHLGADRHSLVITLGGGVVGDMGGFCAATYMRGIDFVHVPTTLLSQVDSAVGGKLGVDHHGYKNMVGLIKNPNEVHIFPEFVKSLPVREIFSGYAEMIKHCLIDDGSFWTQISSINPLTHTEWTDLIYRSVHTKYQITEEDPLEKTVRKKLNFGHTLGHAIESENLKREFPLLHGEAIAIGMICESHIAFQKGLLNKSILDEITQVILDLYDYHPEALTEVTDIIGHTRHDKKNKGGKVLCTLLTAIGISVIDQEITEEEMRLSIDYYLAV